MKLQGLVIVGIVGFALVGCGDSDLGKTVNAPPPTSNKQIEDIQNNPHMPPQAKEAAMARVKAQMEAGKAMSEAAANAPKK